MQNKTAILLLSALAATPLAGCKSNLQAIKPLQRTYVWVPDAPATQPTTQIAATTTAPATQIADATTQPTTAPATQPGHTLVRIIDPNQTSRFLYHGDYDNIWRQASELLTKSGFEIDRTDYRLGILTTRMLPSSQIIEPWKPQQTNPQNALENTMHNQQRQVRLTIATVPNKPDFYEIAIQVLVERETNPAEVIGGPIFVEGSGFGRNTAALRSDYAAPTKIDEPARWVPIGHDPNLEKKLLDQLFKRI